GLCRRAGAEPDRAADLAYMQRLGVGIRVNADRHDAEPARRARDAAGDLAAIGDEQRADHGAGLMADRSSRTRCRDPSPTPSSAGEGLRPAAEPSSPWK